MAILGSISLILRLVGANGLTGATSLITGVSAAPGLLVTGVPFAKSASYPMAIIASIPLWMILGWVASRRATMWTLASWRDYWRQMIYLTLAVMIGCVIALVGAALIVGRSLLT